MIARVYSQKEPLNIVLNDRKGEKLKLNWQTWDVLEATIKALEPLAPLTDALSGIYLLYQYQDNKQKSLLYRCLCSLSLVM